jgi:hypothetical protein
MSVIERENRNAGESSYEWDVALIAKVEPIRTPKITVSCVLVDNHLKFINIFPLSDDNIKKNRRRGL